MGKRTTPWPGALVSAAFRRSLRRLLQERVERGLRVPPITASPRSTALATTGPQPWIISTDRSAPRPTTLTSAISALSCYTVSAVPRRPQPSLKKPALDPLDIFGHWLATVLLQRRAASARSGLRPRPCGLPGRGVVYARCRNPRHNPGAEPVLLYLQADILDCLAAPLKALRSASALATLIPPTSFPVALKNLFCSPRRPVGSR